MPQDLAEIFQTDRATILGKLTKAECWDAIRDAAARMAEIEREADDKPPEAHPANPPRRLLDYKQLALYLSIGRSKARELVDAGEIAKTMIGHRVLFDQVDIDAYVDRAKRKS